MPQIIPHCLREIPLSIQSVAAMTVIMGFEKVFPICDLIFHSISAFDTEGSIPAPPVWFWNRYSSVHLIFLYTVPSLYNASEWNPLISFHFYLIDLSASNFHPFLHNHHLSGYTLASRFPVIIDEGTSVGDVLGIAGLFRQNFRIYSSGTLRSLWTRTSFLKL